MSPSEFISSFYTQELLLCSFMVAWCDNVGLVSLILLDWELQIPQGLSESDEGDELYEEVEDTLRQHSQFTTWYSLSANAE